MYKYIIQLIISVLLINITNTRVIYVLNHAEKPGEGVMDSTIDGGETMSSMEGLGHKPDGLGYTGMLRTICMMDNFGPNAPPYRQPKRIFIQHFMYQNNGDFIHNGKRGHHTSRRMYHQTYALARALGIDLDKELCCGGSYDDIVGYINSLPPEDDPVLIVNQHSVCNHVIQSLYQTYGHPPPENFGKEPGVVRTLIDGQIVEEWYMCCPAISGCKCTDQSITPDWAKGRTFAAPKPPLPLDVQYPSYIYTPVNLRSPIGWSYGAVLRKRGLWSGEECINEDIVKPVANLTKRSDFIKKDSQQSQNNTINNDPDDPIEKNGTTFNSSIISSFTLLLFTLFMVRQLFF
ncbi:hypothetical protein LY90DRAFT_678505 [Neocallimastix californiae]|jgi:hypothetical protein|uniref:Uncharacterized protein n=1 Tax=Neocallimastix californiae TaxID=1754190 RepID=A0A1Y1Z3M5_9FUNG|nr:hypothetical protein LY90DRAFT_678505 [Neocallimastix californiae]|eukprot:ORY04704.1 hypothetical protein LY90DRAFT_678505 [Neocallimastix californiae]